MRHIIVIGKTGQLARALADRASDHDIKITSFGRMDCDLSAATDVISNFAASLPQCDGIIIAAAYTAVDAAEDDTDTAMQVNGVAPGIFAGECVKRNIPLVHVSTDYVFPGHGSKPVRPDTPTDPLNAYGVSKLSGELAVINSGARAAILRTAWVFDGTGKNFMTTMLRLAKDRKALSVVADQIGRPTYAPHLADACLSAIHKLSSELDFTGGIYHVTGSGEVVSWAEFADAIFAQAIAHIPHTMDVNYIPSSGYPTPAKRPAYSVLELSHFEETFGYTLPKWRKGLARAVKEWETTLNKR